MAGIMTRQTLTRLCAGWTLISGGTLGTVMVLVGLMDRAIGRYPSTLSHLLGLQTLIGFGLPRETLTWCLICFGMFWWGAVCAFALRPSWGWIVVLITAVPSLLLAPLGTVVGISALIIAAGSHAWGSAASS
jgi:hypothetical protein